MAKISYHALRCRLSMLSKGGDVMPCPMLPTVCSFKGRCCQATPDVVLLCVPSKGGDVMPRPTSFDRGCFPKARWHAMPDVVRLFMLPKSDVGMPRPMSFDRVCFSKEMMACHARRYLTVCVVEKW